MLFEIQEGESETLEFKKSLSEWKEIIETISAFSNTKGGLVLVGISDRGEIIGVQIGKKTIKENTDPVIFPSISIEKFVNKNIIAIRVEESKSKPVFAFDRVYKRIGRSTVKASSEEIRKMALEGKKVYFDEQICSDANLDFMDLEKINWYLRKREEIRKIKKPEEMSLDDLLINLGAVKEINGKIKPTNAGILFFGKYPQRFIFQARIQAVRFYGNEISRHTIDSTNCEGTLWKMVEDAETFVRKNIRLYGFRTEYSFRRIDKLEYPIKAVREAIINALIHRDYSGTPDIKVFIFDNRIEIINYGSFPEGTTPERPMHLPRNPILCQLMHDVGFIEKYGSGIYLMKSLCREWGIPDPEFEIDQYWTKVIFKSGDRAVVIPEIEKLGVNLNESQRNALKYTLNKGSITKKEYMELNKVSNKTASGDLDNLVKKSLLIPEVKGRMVKYLVNI